MLLKHELVFGTIQDALLKTLIMMSGELEYPDIFFNNGKVPFPGVTYTIFVIFFLLISIVTLNLLVGLTVDDIKASLDQAEIRNLTLKVSKSNRDNSPESVILQLTFVLRVEQLISRIFKFNKYFLNLVKIQTVTLKNRKGKKHMDDVVSKRRIWSQIIKKSIDDLKKVSLE